MTDAPVVRWTKSSRSASNGNCVETAVISGRVAVRDSKDPEGPRLSFDQESWNLFISGVKDGNFDLSELP